MPPGAEDSPARWAAYGTTQNMAVSTSQRHVLLSSLSPLGAYEGFLPMTLREELLIGPSARELKRFNGTDIERLQ